MPPLCAVPCEVRTRTRIIPKAACLIPAYQVGVRSLPQLVYSAALEVALETEPCTRM